MTFSNHLEHCALRSSSHPIIGSSRLSGVNARHETLLRQAQDPASICVTYSQLRAAPLTRRCADRDGTGYSKTEEVVALEGGIEDVAEHQSLATSLTKVYIKRDGLIRLSSVIAGNARSANLIRMANQITAFFSLS
jgi:hypothetical protein